MGKINEFQNRKILQKADFFFLQKGNNILKQPNENAHYIVFVFLFLEKNYRKIN